MAERLEKGVSREAWINGLENRTQTLELSVIPPLLQLQREELSYKGKVFLNHSIKSLRSLCSLDLLNGELMLLATRQGVVGYGHLYGSHDEDTMKISQSIIDALSPKMSLSLLDGIGDLSDKIIPLEEKGLARRKFEGTWIEIATIIPGIAIAYNERSLEKYVLVNKTIHPPLE